MKTEKKRESPGTLHRRLRLFSKRYLLSMLILLLLASAVCYYFFWHLRPFTQNAFVFANTRIVSPLVPGYITEVYVRNNQFVRKGTPLFQTFRPPYTLEVAQLSAKIASAEAEERQIGAEILSAEARIRKLTAALENDRYLSGRANQMYGADAVSQAYAEERLRALQGSEAALEAEKHQTKALTHRKEAVHHTISKLHAALKLARIYEEQTTVRALSDGYVTNMSLSPGGYYKPGDVLFGFVDTSEWFVQANFNESELSEIKPGMTAHIWLRQYPGKVFSGVVGDPGWSTERRKTSPETGLPVVEPENEWFLLPQRYPIQIRITPSQNLPLLHSGGSAYVELDAWSRPVRQFFWELFLWKDVNP